MSALDRLLGLMLEQNAHELRLGPGDIPSLVREGDEHPLSMPVMDGAGLRALLGDLYTPAREAALRNHGQVDFRHEPPGLEAFQVVFRLRGRPMLGSTEPPRFEVLVFRIAAHSVVRSPLAETAMARASVESTLIVPKGDPWEPSSPKSQAFAEEPTSIPQTLANARRSTQRSHSKVSVREGAAWSKELLALVLEAQMRGGSDLHLQQDKPAVLRVNGMPLRLQAHRKLDLGELLAGAMSTEQLARWKEGESLDVALGAPDGQRLRLHAFFAGAERAAAIRLLPATVPSPRKLGLPVDLVHLTELPSGLVLFCGPTGSGKSTTQAALIQERLRQAPLVVSTVEDPVEYLLDPGMNGAVVYQQQIGSDVPNMASGLRRILRQDPDLVLIGEMRDAETIAATLTAAETGHLVFASLHTPSAELTIERMLDAYEGSRQNQVRSQLAQCLRAVVCQRLVADRDGDARVACFETLEVSYAAAAMIREGRTSQLSQTFTGGDKLTNRRLEQDLASKVRAGLIRRVTAEKVANNPRALVDLLK